MLSRSHNRAYQDFLALLIGFQKFMSDYEKQLEQQSPIKQEFKNLQQWFDLNIATLNSQNLAPEVISRWQSIQTEIKREFKLLSTDILFLASARQKITLTKRLQSISDRLAKLIDYCQICLE